MATIHVDVVSAEEQIFSGEAKFVALPGENGELVNHEIWGRRKLTHIIGKARECWRELH